MSTEVNGNAGEKKKKASDLKPIVTGTASTDSASGDMRTGQYR